MLSLSNMAYDLEDLISPALTGPGVMSLNLVVSFSGVQSCLIRSGPWLSGPVLLTTLPGCRQRLMMQRLQQASCHSNDNQREWQGREDDRILEDGNTSRH